MTDKGPRIIHQHWRAPAADQHALLNPGFRHAAQEVTRNQQQRESRCVTVQGRTLAELSTAARERLVQLARQFTSEYLDLDPGHPPLGNGQPIILAGHQPQLIHPGVWYKNFVLHALAQETRGIGINLIIDNDLARHVAIRVPVSLDFQSNLRSIPLDRRADAIPYEQRPVESPELFDAFGESTCAAIHELIAEPIFRQLWPDAIAGRKAQANLGLALAQARHRLEWKWGLRTWEIPLSWLAETDEFREFAGRILTAAADFQRIHNQALREYRAVHRLRSQSHPVPALRQRDEWTEVPFWVWSDREPTRRPLWVRQRATGSMERELELSDLSGNAWPLGKSGQAGLIGSLGRLAGQGVKVRPRALITTMYARLCLSDQFIHGIGGAKYDQLTDRIASEFWGVEMPSMVVATATFRLPLGLDAFDPEPLAGLQAELRALRFHPERFLAEDRSAAKWIAEKAEWIQREPPRGQRRERHRHLVRLNQALHQRLAGREADCLARIEQLRLEERRYRQLASREFSFGLFPERSLRGPLLELSRQES